jgi:predicted amidohydrolase YtcJ
LEHSDRTVLTSRIHSLAGPGAVFDWMAFSGGRVTDLGSGPVPEELRCASRTLDLSGRAVIPALHDCHVHFLETGLLEVDVDLSVASTMGDVLDILRDAARSFEGRLLRAHTFDPDLLQDGRYPTSAELDELGGGIPMLVKRRDGHSSVVSTAAAKLLEVDPATPGVELDGAGRPTGVLREDAYSAAARVAKRSLSDEERVDCFHRAARLAAERGIGIVNALAGSADPGNRDVELLMEAEESLPVDIVIWPQYEDVDRVRALGLPRIGGCILLDGSFSSGTAALTEPYADSDGNGCLYYTDDFLVGFYREAHARGLQVAVHALGGRAISQALGAIEEACGTEARDSRFRIEHFELPTPAHVAEALRLGVAASVQPTFEFLWGGPGGMYEKRLGRARAARSNPFRTLLDSGLVLGGGSDSYVTRMDSILGIHSAVNRPNPDEQLGVFDAVSLFTRNAARLSFDEARRGTLGVGKEASFTVLAEDPFEVDPSTIRDIEVVSLYLRGEEVVAGKNAA